MKVGKAKKVLFLFVLMCCMTSQVVVASAKDVREQIKFLEEEPKNDILAPLTDVAEDTLASSVKLVRACGIGILFLALLVDAIGIAVTKEATAKGDKKARLIWLIVGAVIFFGGTAVIIWSGDIGNAINQSAAASTIVTPTP